MKKYIIFVILIILILALLMKEKPSPVLVLEGKKQFKPKPGDIVPLIVEENGERKYYK